MGKCVGGGVGLLMAVPADPVVGPVLGLIGGGLTEGTALAEHTGGGAKKIHTMIEDFPRDD